MTADKLARKQSESEHQAYFYGTQDADYRREWWKWAATQRNFHKLVKVCKERDPRVLRIRDMWIAEKDGK